MSKDIHSIYFKFHEHFYNKNKHEIDYKWAEYGTGCDFVDKVKEYQKNNPEILLASCDDEDHANANFVFIPHKTDTEWMGTTVIYMRQSGWSVDFFLYPNQLNSVMKALAKLQQMEQNCKGKNE